MRTHSRSVVGSLTVAMISVLSAIALALGATIQTAVNLLAGTALIVPGTGTANPTTSADYMDNARDYFIVPSDTGCAPADCELVPVPYIAQFWPFPFTGWGGLQGAKWDDSVQSGVVSLSMTYGGTSPTTSDPVTVFGYSQGATVTSIFKRSLAELNGGTIPEGTFFTLIGNPNRPDGGLFERLAILGTLPILDATFGEPTPTDTAPDDLTNTTDTVFQYDGIGDMASNILNVPAVLNALLGFWYVHGTYLDPRGRPPNNDIGGELAYGYTPEEIEEMVAGCVADSSGPNCQQHGDTVYVTIPATYLPIIQPFLDLGSATGTSALINPIVALVQPALQTVIEAGYNRGDYGNPTPFQLIPRVNPIKFVGDLLNDIPEGINAAIATINDPDHNIPDLPPVWGDSSSSATAVVADDSELLATTTELEPATTALDLPKPKLELAAPKLDLPKLELPKLTRRDSVPSADAVESTEPKTRADITPVRDLTKALRAKLRDERPEKAPSRLKPKKAEQSTAPDKAADDADNTAEKPAA
jgi:PE-PPE domain